MAPYIDARAVRRRLNEVVGPFKWTNELHGVSIGA